MTIEINLNEKRKKGRPKKNLQITLNDASYTLQSQVSVVPEKDDEKKKRGRKKKEVVEEEVKIKKKRGRKAALKYFSSSIRKQIPLKTNIVDNENGILFLDIKESNENLANTSLTYDSFDTNNTDQFDIKEQFDNHHKLQYMTHGVDTEFYSFPERVEWMTHPTILCVGNNGIIGNPLFDRKVFLYAFEAASRLGFKIKIAGPRISNERYFNTWGDISRVKNLEIRYDLNDEQLRDLYQQCDVLAHVSSIEAGQPCLTIAEALSCGLPVVGTSVDRIEKGMYFIERNDNDSEGIIKNIMQGIISIRNSYPEYNKKAREFALNTLDWKLITNKLESFYYQTI
jgi:glycosyltransferase involved in cell wall biosynthesis